MKSPAPKTALAHATRWLLVVGSLIIIYTIVGFFVLPAVVKAQLVKRLPGLTHRQTAVGQVEFNPYTFALTVKNFSLKETNGDVFTSFDRFYVNLQLSTLWQRGWIFDEISLKNPFVQVTYFKDGSFNFDNLLDTNAPAPVAPAPSAPPRLLVHRLHVINGAFSFIDFKRKTAPFRSRYQPVNINLTNFSTVHDEGADYEIAATGQTGDRLDWTGTISLDPLRTSGRIRLSGLQLNHYRPYSQDYARFEIVDGKIDAALSYSYDSSSNALDLSVTNGGLILRDLQMRAPETSENILSVPDFSIRDVQASLLRRTVEVGQIETKGGFILLRQQQDGSINFVSNLIPAPVASVTPALAPPVTNQMPWEVKIDRVALEQYALTVEDRTPARKAEFKAEQIGLTLSNISIFSNQPVLASLNLRLQPGGTLRSSGDLTLHPVQGNFQVAASNLDLQLAQPYLQNKLNLAITRGFLDLTGRIHLAPPESKAPRFSFAGAVAVRDFAATDEKQYRELGRWNALDITGIDFAAQPGHLHLDAVKSSGLKTDLTVNPDHQLNFSTLLTKKTNAPAVTAAVANQNAPAASNSFPFSLDALILQDASIHFTDRSIEPNCSFTVEDFSGEVDNLSTETQNASQVNFNGKIDASSTFHLTGKINPAPGQLFADLTATCTNIGLTSFSPYAEKFTGRPLSKGRLSLALRYQIDHKVLTAANGVFLDQLTLGPKNNDPNATKLPVKLAIALLKDRKGRINLDLPVHGRLDNPQFKVTKIIWGAVNDLIIKAATSPFSLLGSMFGGGPGLSFVAFAPGQTEISADESKKLDTLARALYERPTLTLDISGSVDPVADRPELLRAILVRHIKRLYLDELAAAGHATMAADQLQLPAEDYQRLLRQDYTNTLPPTPAASEALAAAPTVVQLTTNIAPTVVSPLPVLMVYDLDQYFSRGAPQLMLKLHPPVAFVSAPPPPPPSQPAPVVNTPVVEPAPTPPPAQTLPDTAAMELKLEQGLTITADDFRRLMQERAQKVEGYLLKTGKVGADRLFILAPATVDARFQGQDRANLSLD